MPRCGQSFRSDVSMGHAGGGATTQPSRLGTDELRQPYMNEDLITMTWAQYRRGECCYRGRAVKLQREQANLPALLLLRRGQVVSPEEIMAFLNLPRRKPPPSKVDSLRKNLSRLKRILPDVVGTYRHGYGIGLPPADQLISTGGGEATIKPTWEFK